jgi:hypothetical protein
MISAEVFEMPQSEEFLKWEKGKEKRNRGVSESLHSPSNLLLYCGR